MLSIKLKPISKQNQREIVSKKKSNFFLSFRKTWWIVIFSSSLFPHLTTFSKEEKPFQTEEAQILL